MAVYKIFPEKDATIYSGFNLKNTGIDEILEISTFLDTTNPEVSRALVKFSQTEIEDVVLNIISGSTTNENGTQTIGSASFQSNLRLYIADITGLNADTTLEVFAVSGSYNMGTGRFTNDPETLNGVSWAFRNSSGSAPWDLATFGTFATASFISTNGGGGNWYTGSNAGLAITESQVLSYASDKDLNVDVTNYVNTWVSNSFNSSDGFSNDGFLIKQSNSDEFIDDENYVTGIKYFSVDTHTIYPPKLEFRFRDALFNTGSSATTTISTSRLVASLDNNPNTFRSGSIAKIRVNCRPQFPNRVFQTASLYTTNHYLPTHSFYAVKDLDTNEFIIDFDTNYTKLSQDHSGSYFKLYMNGLQPERYYQILLKTTIEDETLILDDNYYFKVING
jgi:hypothetical protein